MTALGIGDTVFWQTQDGVEYGSVIGLSRTGSVVTVHGDDRFTDRINSSDLTKIGPFEVGDIVSVGERHAIVESVFNPWRELTVSFEIGSSGTTSRTVKQYRAEKVG